MLSVHNGSSAVESVMFSILETTPFICVLSALQARISLFIITKSLLTRWISFQAMFLIIMLDSWTINRWTEIIEMLHTFKVILTEHNLSPFIHMNSC